MNDEKEQNGCWEAWFAGLAAALAQPANPQPPTHLVAPHIGSPRSAEPIVMDPVYPLLPGDIW